MTVASDIIENALSVLGAHSPLNPAPPETLQRGLTELQQLLRQWQNVENFQVGATIPTALGSDLDEILECTAAIQYGLAFRLAPVVRQPIELDVTRVGDDIIRVAREGFQFTVPDPRPIPLIRGQGNRLVR